MTIMLSTFCAAIVIVSVLGGILPLATVLNHTRLQVYLSFSAGTMLGTAFFHMLPEAVRVGSADTLGWTAFGLLGVFFLERFFSFHQHEPRDPPALGISMPEPVAHAGRTPGAHHHEDGRHDHTIPTRPVCLSWASAALGLMIHSLVGGVALASAVEADYRVGKGTGGAGLGVFIATLVHKPADALTITALMVRSGVPRGFTHLVNLGFALMIPAGVALFWIGTAGIGPASAGAWTAIALAFSAGTFLCIALSDLLPELQFHSHDRLKLSVRAAGWILPDGGHFDHRLSLRFRRFLAARVDLLGVEDGPIHNFQALALSDPPEETRAIPLVARAALLAHLDQEHIRIAVDADGVDELHVPRGSTLVPERPARSRIKMRLPGFERRGQSLAVHPCHHEDLARFRILHDGRNQAIRIPFQQGHQRRLARKGFHDLHSQCERQ